MKKRQYGLDIILDPLLIQMIEKTSSVSFKAIRTSVLFPLGIVLSFTQVRVKVCPPTIHQLISKVQTSDYTLISDLLRSMKYIWVREIAFIYLLTSGIRLIALKISP